MNPSPQSLRAASAAIHEMTADHDSVPPLESIAETIEEHTRISTALRLLSEAVPLLDCCGRTPALAGEITEFLESLTPNPDPRTQIRDLLVDIFDGPEQGVRSMSDIRRMQAEVLGLLESLTPNPGTT